MESHYEVTVDDVVNADVAGPWDNAEQSRIVTFPYLASDGMMSLAMLRIERISTYEGALVCPHCGGLTNQLRVPYVGDDLICSACAMGT